MTEQPPADQPDQPEQDAAAPDPGHEPEPSEPTGPPTIEVETDPITRGEQIEKVDEIRNDLIDRLKADVEAAGWNTDAVDVNLHLVDIDETHVLLRAEAILREDHDARPARWERVRSEKGYRLRLKGANGEKVVWSEHYADPRDVEHALALVQHAVNAAAVGTLSVVSGAATAQAKSGNTNALTPLLVDVDERGEPDPADDEA